MSSVGSRAFSTGGKRALKWVGSTKTDIINLNPGKNGAGVVQAIEKIEAEAEAKYGNKAAILLVQGAKLHPSTKDPGDKKEVVTVSILTEGGTRLESGHAHEDGTTTGHVTRSGGSK
ncbi:hypothetical protein QM012_008669 [Aureobasidium pullulans]|uniref:Uncharacterized protein n=1 Tax=Aureobasidium pullulans TaxID=5580 RepID=A0ABR0TKY1_AURPU